MPWKLNSYNEHKVHVKQNVTSKLLKFSCFVNIVLLCIVFFISWTSYSLWVVSGGVQASGVSIPLSVTAYYVCSFVTGLSHSGWHSLDASIFLGIS